MIEALSEKIAISIKKSNEAETVSVAVMKFALIILFNFFIPVLLSLLIGLLTDRFGETLLSLTAFVLLRMSSGGYHFKSPIACMLSTLFVATVPPLIDLSREWSMLVTGVSLLLFLLLAPSNMRGYHTLPEKYYPVLKLLCVSMVAANFPINSDTVALVSLLQGISLLKWKEV
jgi:accessory gene regulator B